MIENEDNFQDQLDDEEAERKFQPHFMLTSEIDDEMADRVLVWLAKWKRKDENQDLSIHINNCGGDPSSSMLIAEAMQITDNPVRTVITGKCYSGAVLVAAAGNKGERYAFKTSEYLLHQVHVVSFPSVDSVIDIEKEVIGSQLTNANYLKLLSQLTGRSLKQVKADTQRNNYLNAEEARDYGIIDHIAEWKRK